MAETPQQTEARRSAALDKAISTPRYASYLQAAGQDKDLARRLYVWDRDLSSAIHADIAIVEVALRNAMHAALTAVHGPEWYQRIALDDRSQNQVAQAWDWVVQGWGDPSVSLPDHASIPGRFVAQCTFGMWVNLLDAGGWTGREPRRVHVDYEPLWRSTLHLAFPWGRHEARNDPNPNAEFTRTWVHSVAQTVNVLRNRVAHHEPLLNGFPLTVQCAGQDQTSRMTVAEGVRAYMTLTRMIDRDLAEWILSDTKVTALLASRRQ